MEIKTDNVPAIKSANTEVNDLLMAQVRKTDNVKIAIDLATTKSALEQEGTVETLVSEKTNELKNDAQAKRIEAETHKIEEETKRVIAERTKEIEEYDKVITTKRKEVEQLKAESDKAEAYFEANKDILKYIGVRSKKSLRVMNALMVPAIIIFLVIQFLLLPLTFAGVVLENVVNIVGLICESIKNSAVKIVVGILVVCISVGLLLLAYIYGGKLIAGI